MDRLDSRERDQRLGWAGLTSWLSCGVNGGVHVPRVVVDVDKNLGRPVVSVRRAEGEGEGRDVQHLGKL